jgi:phosphatidylinositol alpha-mannosyltransferase
MKILMVSETYYPYIGGIPDHIFYLSRHLRQKGHEVKILTSRFGSYEPEADVIRLLKGFLIRANKSYARLAVGLRPSDKVKRVLERESPDVVHIHGSLSLTLPVLAIRHSRSINVMTFHAGHRRSTGYLLFNPLLIPYFKKLHGLIAVSEVARDSMTKYFPGAYQLIPNGVDTETFSPDLPPLPQFENHPGPKILFMGRFEPRKGLPYLLRALPYIREEFPRVLLIIVGSGPFEARYRRMVVKELSRNVAFIGTRRGKLRASFYASCDLFCSPSIGNESFGMTILEAMASGKPIVASDIPGFHSVLQDGVEGLFFRPQDPKDLAQKCIKILKEPALGARMGQLGRRKALNYSWPKITQMVEDYYLELLNSYPKGRYGPISFF